MPNINNSYISNMRRRRDATSPKSKAMIPSVDWIYGKGIPNSGISNGTNAAKESGLKSLFGKAKSFMTGKNITYDKGTGISVAGKNLGKYVPWGVGIYNGIGTLQNVDNMSDGIADSNAYITDILQSASANPIASSYLTSDQQMLLNKIRNGSYDNTVDLADTTSNLGNILMGAGKGALVGIGGGAPGTIVGAISGALKAGSENASNAQAVKNAELAGLYQALSDAEAQYRSMKRPNFTGLGIQQRYENMYM